MTNKSRVYPMPKFNNLEEEEKFWQSHSPIIEGYEGKVQKKKQKRASFLSVRLTGEELAYLRERATHYGLGPSTYARQVLIRAMESGEGNLPPELLFRVFRLLRRGPNNQQQEKEFEQLYKIFEEYQKRQDEFARLIAPLLTDFAPPDSVNKLLREKTER